MPLPLQSGRYLLAILFAMASGVARASCGSAYCLVNTNWDTQGAMTAAGSELDLRYEFIHQDTLMNGDSRTHAAHEDGEHDEASTTNRNLQLAYRYMSADGWGVSVQLPLVSREHTHFHNEDEGPEREQWDFNAMGDARVLGQYRLSVAGHHSTTYGLLAGIKLPTGQFDIDNRMGEQAERSLQPGTGTTDVLAGAYFSRKLADAPGTVFAQVLGQSALNTRNHFRPGEQLGVDVGYRHPLNGRFAINLQANYLVKRRDDGGREAEPDESGLQSLYLSPGFTYGVTPRLQLYGFVQLPVYQDVNGTQLTADRAVAVGVANRF